MRRAAQVIDQAVPAGRRVADPEALDQLLVHAALGEVLARGGAVGPAQLGAEEGAGGVVRAVGGAGLVLLAAGLGDVDPELAGEGAHGIGEIERVLLMRNANTSPPAWQPKQ